MKPESPYKRLQMAVFRYFMHDLFSIPKKRVEMCAWGNEALRADAELSAIRERVAAAGQLGYDVVLESPPNGGLRVLYQKRIPMTFSEVGNKELVGWLTNF